MDLSEIKAAAFQLADQGKQREEIAFNLAEKFGVSSEQGTGYAEEAIEKVHG